jgi:hypothetical protein
MRRDMLILRALNLRRETFHGLRLVWKGLLAMAVCRLGM